MSQMRICAPLTKDIIKTLKVGDEVLLSGVIFTARDAAHKKLVDMISGGRHIPINLKDQVIYYAGPTPAYPGKTSGPTGRRPGGVIGSCGPTTGSRMDEFTLPLLRLGLAGMIGKGDRSDEVKAAIKKYGCVYFLATGGIGALLSTKIKKARPILFKELGPEAIYKLEVKDFPLTVGIDSKGRDVYAKIERKKK